MKIRMAHENDFAHRAASAKRRVFEFLLVSAIKGASPSVA